VRSSPVVRSSRLKFWRCCFDPAAVIVVACERHCSVVESEEDIHVGGIRQKDLTQVIVSVGVGSRCLFPSAGAVPHCFQMTVTRSRSCRWRAGINF
jgi:hypothetical protein